MTTELQGTTPSAKIAAEVRAEMARQGLTQQEFADLLGVTQWWVSRRLRESSATDITAAELVQIARSLGVPVLQLLTPAIDSAEEAAA